MISHKYIKPFYLHLLIALILLLSKVLSDNTVQDENYNNANVLAHQGDINGLIKLATKNKKLLFAADQNGWTPLHEASRSVRILIISFLIGNGADANAKTTQGNKASDLLADSTSSFRYALARTILERAENGMGLDDHSINKDALSNSNEIILHFPGLANALSQFGLTEELVELYALDKNIVHERDRNDWTPLHEAVRHENIDSILFLLKMGADLNAKTIDGRTVLDLATSYGNSDVVNACLSFQDGMTDKVENAHGDNDDDIIEENDIVEANDPGVNKVDIIEENDIVEANGPDDNNDNADIKENDIAAKDMNHKENVIKEHVQMGPIQLFFKKIRNLLLKMKLFFAAFVK